LSLIVIIIKESSILKEKQKGNRLKLFCCNLQLPTRTDFFQRTFFSSWIRTLNLKIYSQELSQPPFSLETWASAKKLITAVIYGFL
jgi:hypothetical protein